MNAHKVIEMGKNSLSFPEETHKILMCWLLSKIFIYIPYIGWNIYNRNWKFKNVMHIYISI
jgi:hypothetical protein